MSEVYPMTECYKCSEEVDDIYKISINKLINYLCLQCYIKQINNPTIKSN